MVKNNYRKLSFMIVSVSHLTAIFIVITVNIATEHILTWALYPVLSMFYVWAIAATAILKQKGKLVAAFIVSSALLIPYLYFLERITRIDGWFVRLALPIALIVIAAVWVFFFLFSKLKSSSENEL
ncbi:MAG: DUF6320 domain-containing protein [Oscillospiraceae bacterium]|jgi:hypothetical protein|nr:DUF6320 domain-containing protein [Oscillospiraceae bacterium]